jgi:hypothetical protein
MVNDVLGSTASRCIAVKILRLFLPVCLLLIGANAVFADGSTPDPKILMGGGGSCQSFSEDSLTQTFFGVKTGCVVDFTNNITSNDQGVTLDLLVVNVDTPFSGALSCDITADSPLQGTPTVSSPTSCTFQDPSGVILSIDPGEIYSLSFINPCTIGCGFPAFIDITLAQTVIPAPEPATILLLGVGLAVLFAGSKKFKDAGPRAA